MLTQDDLEKIAVLMRLELRPYALKKDIDKRFDLVMESLDEVLGKLKNA